MKNKKYWIFIICCVLAILGSLGLQYIIQYRESTLRTLYIDFIDLQESYEVGSQLSAISFIKKTNATDIKYPEIDTSVVGEKNFFYIAFDENGNSKEFILKLNIVDSVFPIIELKESLVEVTEGEVIDLHGYVQRVYDPIDGDLDYEIITSSDYTQIGEHEVIFSCQDKNGNVTQAILKIVVKQKPEVHAPSQKPSTEGINRGEIVSGQSPAQKPILKPISQQFLFKDGYNMQTASNACLVEFEKAEAGGYSASCKPLYENGLAIGMEFIVK